MTRPRAAVVAAFAALAVLMLTAETSCQTGHGPAPQCQDHPNGQDVYARWEQDLHGGNGGWVCPP